MRCFFYLVLAGFCAPSSVSAQYKGGVNDGVSLAGNAGLNVMPAIFDGGNNDGGRRKISGAIYFAIQRPLLMGDYPGASYQLILVREGKSVQHFSILLTQ